MRISDVLKVKGDQVVTVQPDVDVEHLLVVLAEHRIGAVIVSRDGTRVDGIVSERDVVRALAARGAGVLAEPVSAIHTSQVRTVEPDANLEDVERLMTEHRFRHVPVVSAGTLRGVVSIGDVVKNRIDELEAERSSLAGYITGERDHP
jgi:CBS domain-containing protein